MIGTVPTFVSGLPLHPLVVHVAVVLVPAAVLGALVVALWPAARRRWGWPVVALTALAAISVPLATSTGEGLEHNLPRSPAIATHAELGDQLILVGVPTAPGPSSLRGSPRDRRGSQSSSWPC